jgi:hypothetical protein
MTANLANLPNLPKRYQTSGNVIRKIREYGKTGKWLQLSATSANLPTAAMRR